MGEVYRVEDASTGRALALKRFVSKEGQAERQKLRFRREFHTMARLRHPRIVEVYDYGVDEGIPYYTMELLDGRDLGDLGAVPPLVACGLLRDVASALTFLHPHRLVHRDLAPRNVRCTGEGKAKVIDFGVVATPGLCGDVAGTPPVLSPENVRGLPIDHRVDLYGLGALGYYLVAGKHAYPARTLEDLEPLWRRGVVPLGQLVADLPPGLEDLVMSMLSLDPLGRPVSAAEVVERLGTIDGQPSPPELSTAQGYLASAAMVGRQREVEVARRRIAKANQGTGSTILVEAPSGNGKSRLLREIALEAQLAGAVAFDARGDASGHGPYGVLHELALGLVSGAPEEALAAARKVGPTLGRIVPELAAKLDWPGTAPAMGGLEEERIKLQTALASWITSIASTRTVVVLVDDVQRADEASAAVLASLAHEAEKVRLVVVAAVRTDERIRASAALVALREVGVRLRLHPLTANDIGTLLRDIFGDVPYIARLSTWLQRASGGNPLHCMELARHMVDRGALRLVDGVWSIAEDFTLEGLPRELEGAMDARVATLPEGALALAEVLSVHGGELSLALCMALAGDSPEKQTFDALDQLLDAEVLLGAEERYSFRHDGLREALLRRLDGPRRAELHLRVGRALEAAEGTTAEREGEIGWHLLGGGERGRGAELLARAGRRLFEAQSFSDCVAPLEAAVRAFEAEKKDVRSILELRHMLVLAGCLGDKRAALEFGPDTLRAHARFSGMDVARALPRWLPGFLVLGISIAAVSLRRLVTPRHDRGPPPLEAIPIFYAEAAYLAFTSSFFMDFDGVRKVGELLEPLRVLSSRIPGGAWLLVRTALDVSLGRFASVRRATETILEILSTDRVTPIAPSDRANARGGALYMRAMAAVFRQDPSYLDEIAEMEALGLRYFDVTASICRLTYRRFRGEEQDALSIESTVDLKLVQAGSLWGPESQIVWLSALAYGLTRDVLGLRRSILALTRLVEQGFCLQQHLDLARGEYLRERGDLEGARAALESVLAGLDPEEACLRVAALVALSETHLAAGEGALAETRAAEALECGNHEDVVQTTWCVRASRARALAKAALGDVEGAIVLLERALDATVSLGSPLLSGSLHEARARIALAQGDMPAYAIHRQATASWFRATKNPALVGRAERLRDVAVVLGHVGQVGAAETLASQTAMTVREDLTRQAVTIASSSDSTSWVSAVLSGCRGPDERAARALEVLLDDAGASAGYLYLWKAGRPYIVAPMSGDEPPETVVQELVEGPPPASGDAGTLDLDWRPSGITGKLLWRRAWLEVDEGSAERTRIGMVLLAGDDRSRAPTPAVLSRVARELFDAGDATASASRRWSHPAGA